MSDSHRRRSSTFDRPVENLPGKPLFTVGTAVLAALACDARLSKEGLAKSVGVSVRHVARVVDELERAGYIRVAGRPNRRRYELIRTAPLSASAPGPSVG